ncbi:glycosyl transferase family 2 [Gloeothece citriformis PCC 7424]|uniref:Glycosyl transferase family 2 n=1 Tax=Gloeothece citriformis (strain PCC 7424) TaxID=65393 RepID=B7KBX6_GLOC7|nr:glycosyltransferase [Gloeothece citriformis]ACK68799.1 glycosyl transferase family 2 [Gloeothece citriformis PCC 7424]
MSKPPVVPAINPVHKGVKRPFWSVMIPTYNCADYLVETLKCVLEQAPSPEQMQIEVVDDCSTKDDPEAVVKEIGQGRVSFYRHPKNIGASANFTSCIQRSQGQWVHILHGDDLVRPGFYAQFRAAAEQNPTIGAGFCYFHVIDEHGNQSVMLPTEKETPGIIEDFAERMFIHNRVMAPAIVVKRSVYEHLGGFHPELFHTADWEMWTRIAVHYPVWYNPELLALYRVHSASDTSKLKRTGANIANHRKAREIVKEYMPKPIVDRCLEEANEFTALLALVAARKMLANADLEAAQAQVQEALLCSRSLRILRQAGWVMLDIGQRKKAINCGIKSILNQPFDVHNWKLLVYASLKPISQPLTT